MSYILDALKRAERERKQGQISVLDELPPAQAAAESRQLPLRWVVIGGAAAVLLVLGPVLLLYFHRSAAPAAAPVVAAAPAVVAVAPQPAPPPPPPAAPQAKIEDSDSIATLDDVTGQPPPGPPADQDQNEGQDGDQDADQPPPDQTASAAPPPPRPRLGPGGRPGLRPPPQAQAAVEGEPPPPPVIDVPPDQQAAAAQQAPAPAPASSSGQQALQEMPEAYRANFPTLSVDVLAYNSNPQRRFVLIAGKRYHEGDTIAEGPRIVSILSDGIVFDWQGQQVLYANGR